MAKKKLIEAAQEAAKRVSQQRGVESKQSENVILAKHICAGRRWRTEVL